MTDHVARIQYTIFMIINIKTPFFNQCAFQVLQPQLLILLVLLPQVVSCSRRQGLLRKEIHCFLALYLLHTCELSGDPETVATR